MPKSKAMDPAQSDPLRPRSEARNPQYYTVQEAASFLGVSSDTLRRWDAKGVLIPYRTAGNQRRYFRDQLERFLKRSQNGNVNGNSNGKSAGEFASFIAKDTVPLPSTLAYLLAEKEQLTTKALPVQDSVASPTLETMIGYVKKALLVVLLFLSALTLYLISLPEKLQEDFYLGLSKQQEALSRNIAQVFKQAEVPSIPVQNITNSIEETLLGALTYDSGQSSLTVKDPIELFGTSLSFGSSSFTTLTTQTVYGGTSSGGDLTLYATSNTTKGNIYFNTTSSYVNAVGVFTGNGSALTSLNATNVTSGTLPNDRLSSNVTKLGGAINLDSGEVTGALGLGNGGTGATMSAVAGAIVYSDSDSFALTIAGTSSQCLLGGTTPAFGTCGTGDDAFWDQSSGALYPANSTVDLLIGGVSTASADFAFINVNSGNPTATISGNLALAVPTTAGANTLDYFNGSTLNFRRSPGGDAGVATTMFLARDGNVGIGTTSPGSTLSVAGAINTPSSVLVTEDLTNKLYTGSFHWDTDRFSLTNFIRIRLGGDTGPSGFGISDYDTAMRFWVERTGNVGINTTAPIATLDVRGLNATTPAASISANSNFAGMVVDNSGLGDLFTASKSGASKFVVKNSGNVGVGTNLPTGLLHVAQNVPSTSNGPTLKLENTNTVIVSAWKMGVIDFASLDSSTNLAGVVGRIELIADQEFSSASTPAGANTNMIFRTNTGNAGTLGEVMRLMYNGNVGINTTTPSFRLDVQDSQAATAAAQLFNTNTGTDADGLVVKLGNTSTTAVANTNHFISFETSGIGIVGSVRGSGGTGVQFQTSGIADFAEYLKKDPDEVIPFGSLICIDKSGKATACKGSGTIAGVASTHGGFTGGDDLGDETIRVGFVGVVQTFVSTASGTIVPGDMITASSIPGVGVKATRSGLVVGKALEEFNEATGKILVLVQPGWHDPNSYITDSGDVNLVQVDPYQELGINQEGIKEKQIHDSEFILHNSGQRVDRVGIFSDATIANLTVGNLDVQELVVKGLPFSSLQGQADGYASLSAQLVVELENQNARIDDLEQRIDNLSFEQSTASNSASLLSDTTVQTLFENESARLDRLFEARQATLSGNLTVAGRTVLNDIGITGDLSMGLLQFKGITGELYSLSGPLKLQSLGLDGVEFLGGKVVIEKNGDMKIEGTLKAKIIETEEVKVLGQTIGSGTIETNQTVVEVSTPAASKNSRIFLTPTTLTSRQLTVTAKDNGKFKVEIAEVDSKPITFDWWIVN